MLYFSNLMVQLTILSTYISEYSRSSGITEVAQLLIQSRR